MKHVPREFRYPIQEVGTAERVDGKWVLENWHMGPPPPAPYDVPGIQHGPDGYEAMGGWPIAELVKIAEEVRLDPERRRLYGKFQPPSPLLDAKWRKQHGSGMSIRTERPRKLTPPRLAGMIVLFVLGLADLLNPWSSPLRQAAGILSLAIAAWWVYGTDWKGWWNR